MNNNLKQVKSIVPIGEKMILAGDIYGIGEMMKEHWELKKKRSDVMSNPDIDNWYEYALKNGAIGGKIAGSGSGGFLMFITDRPNKLREAMHKINLEEMKFNFDFEGTRVL